MSAPTVLTAAQIATLKTFFNTDASMTTLKNNVGTANEDRAAIAAAFNADTANANPWIWKTKVLKAQITNDVSVDATSFIWAGNGYITRSVQELMCFDALFNGSGIVDPSLANVRQAFTDIFSGVGNAASNRTHLASVGRRKATVAERLLATGTGTTASPALLGWEGLITIELVAAILA